MPRLILLTFTLTLFPSLWAKSYDVSCQHEGHNSFLYVVTSLKARITKKAENYTMDGTYRLDLYDDYLSKTNDALTAPKSSIWYSTEGDVPFSNQSNYKNYRPKKYKGHLKWDSFVNIFGKVDLIFPIDVFTNEGKGQKFTAYTILTWISDHYGTTVSLSCSMVEVQ